VSSLRRPKPFDLVLEMTQRLAEEFATVPLPMVTSAVRSAVAAAKLFGNDISASLDTIEQIAREDLVALRETAAEQALLAAAS
jgi:phage-related minor tail protein